MTEIQNLYFTRIIKRLELIKSLLLLEEEDEISMHLEKLQGFPLRVDLTDIINCLMNKHFSAALIQIDSFIHKYNRLVIYVSPEIAGLKLEVKSLETELNKLFSSASVRVATNRSLRSCRHEPFAKIHT